MSVVIRSLAAIVGLYGAGLAHALSPAEGSLSPASPEIVASGGPYLVSNPSGLAADIVCGPELCDDFSLTLDFPADFAARNPGIGVRFDLQWSNPSGAEDLDLYVLDAANENALGASASSDPEERVDLAFDRLPGAVIVRVVPFAVTGATATLTMSVVQVGSADGGEAPDPCVASGAANNGSAQIDAGVLGDWQSLGLNDLYGAFVHFDQGTRKQQDFLLQSLGLTRTHDFRQWARSVYVTGPVAAFQQLVRHPSVAWVEHNAPLQYLGATGPWATRVRVAQEPVSGGPYFDAQGNRLTGKGVTLGVIDSGLFGPHPDFAGRVLHNYRIVTPGSLVPNPIGNPGESLYLDVGEFGDSESTVGGHGTHVTGTVGGSGAASDGGYPEGTAPLVSGSYPGVAPEAQLIHWGHGAGLLVLDAASAYVHIINNVASFDPPLRAVNNSYGSAPGPYNAAATSSCLIKEVVANNVAMVFAAGNDGGDGSSGQTSPTCRDPTPGVICVASYNDLGTGDRNAPLSGFSSRGLKGDPDSYPDIAAPGDLITSTCVQSQTSQAICTGGSDGAAETNWQPFYGTISGTSMAAPHITGLIGLIAQVRPELSPGEIEKLMQTHAIKIGGDYEADPQHPGSTHHFGYGAGLVDLPSILDALGVAKAGLPAAGGETVIFDQQASRFALSGAGDAVRLSSQDVTEAGVSGVLYRLTVADASDMDPTGELIYRVEQNVGGKPAPVSLVFDGATVRAAEPGVGSVAIASRVELDGNTFSFFVPYAQLGFPAVNEPVHNVRVVVENALTAVDYAPAPADTPAAVAALQPMFGKPFTLQLLAGLAPPSDERSCLLPGLTQVLSPAGVSGNGTMTGQDDLRQVWVAEPTDQPGKIVFTLKVDNLDPQPVPAHRWYVYFSVPGDASEYFVAMDTTGLVPSFIYGTRTALDAVATSAGVFEVLGDLDASSGFDTDGTITLVLDKAVLGIETGMVLGGIAGSIRQTTNPETGVGLTVDSGGSIGGYLVVGNDRCVSPDELTSSPVTPTPTPGSGTGAPPPSGDSGGRQNCGLSVTCLADGGGHLGGGLLLVLMGFWALRRRP
jgi:serine protease AprX